MRLARSLKTTGFSLCNCHMGSLNVGMGGERRVLQNCLSCFVGSSVFIGVVKVAGAWRL